MPTHILAEFASVALRKLALDASTVAARVGDLRIAATMGAYDDADIAVAIDLVDRAELSFWDALAVTVCDRAGVPVLASGDLHDGLRCGRTIVVNPFLDANLGKLGL